MQPHGQTGKHDGNRVASLIAVDYSNTANTVAVKADPATGRLLVNSTGGSGVASSFATGQATVTTIASLIVAANASRMNVTIVNHSTTDLYIGGSGVTTSTGVLLVGVKGSAITITALGAIYGIVGSGSITASYEEETT